MSERSPTDRLSDNVQLIVDAMTRPASWVVGANSYAALLEERLLKEGKERLKACMERDLAPGLMEHHRFANRALLSAFSDMESAYQHWLDETARLGLEQWKNSRAIEHGSGLNREGTYLNLVKNFLRSYHILLEIDGRMVGVSRSLEEAWVRVALEEIPFCLRNFYELAEDLRTNLERGAPAQTGSDSVGAPAKMGDFCANCGREKTGGSRACVRACPKALLIVGILFVKQCLKVAEWLICDSSAGTPGSQELSLFGHFGEEVARKLEYEKGTTELTVPYAKKCLIECADSIKKTSRVAGDVGKHLADDLTALMRKFLGWVNAVGGSCGLIEASSDSNDSMELEDQINKLELRDQYTFGREHLPLIFDLLFPARPFNRNDANFPILRSGTTLRDLVRIREIATRSFQHVGQFHGVDATGPGLLEHIQRKHLKKIFEYLIDSAPDPVRLEDIWDMLKDGNPFQDADKPIVYPHLRPILTGFNHIIEQYNSEFSDVVMEESGEKPRGEERAAWERDRRTLSSFSWHRQWPTPWSVRSKDLWYGYLEREESRAIPVTFQMNFFQYPHSRDVKEVALTPFFPLHSLNTPPFQELLDYLVDDNAFVFQREAGLLGLPFRLGQLGFRAAWRLWNDVGFPAYLLGHWAWKKVKSLYRSARNPAGHGVPPTEEETFLEECNRLLDTKTDLATFGRWNLTRIWILWERWIDEDEKKDRQARDCLLVKLVRYERKKKPPSDSKRESELHQKVTEWINELKSAGPEPTAEEEKRIGDALVGLQLFLLTSLHYKDGWWDLKRLVDKGTNSYDTLMDLIVVKRGGPGQSRRRGKDLRKEVLLWLLENAPCKTGSVENSKKIKELLEKAPSVEVERYLAKMMRWSRPGTYLAVRDLYWDVVSWEAESSA